MKKLMMVIFILGTIQASSLNAKMETSGGFPKGVAIDPISLKIQNNTDKTVYIGVYEIIKGKNPELFGDILSLTSKDSSDELRRPKNPKGDVKLYFSTDLNDMSPDIFPDSAFANKVKCTEPKKKLCVEARKGLLSKNDVFYIKAKYLLDSDNASDVIKE